MAQIPFRLCFVTNRNTVKRNIIDVIAEAVEGGVDAIQIREKDLPAKDIYEMAVAVKKRVGNKAKIIVNDRIDAAIAANADGIHLGWKSIPVEKAVGIARQYSMIAGISCHSVEDAATCINQGIDYISFGPVFETPSKAGILDARGVGAIEDVKRHINIPLSAIGGINEENCAEVIKAGAESVSVIGAILDSGNPRKAAENLRGIIDNV